MLDHRTLRTALRSAAGLLLLLPLGCQAPSSGSPAQASPDAAEAEAQVVVDPPRPVIRGDELGHRTEIVLVDGDRVAGRFRARYIHVMEGAQVDVVGDVVLSAWDSIDMDGTLRAVDREPGDEAADAPDIVLEADQRLTVRGRIVAGAGRSFEGLDPAAYGGLAGGDGSSIRLSAPDVLFCTGIVGGAGGMGGGGSDGGHGGTVELVGMPLSLHGFTRREVSEFMASVGCIGGDGGDGGQGVAGFSSGGNGGGSGGALFSRHPGQEEYELDPGGR